MSPLQIDTLVAVSWNTCKKGASTAGRICRHIRSQFGSFVGSLQEIPAWGKLRGFTYSNHTVVSFENCDCGFLIPRPWMSAVRSLSSGAYWCGLVIDTCIFISAHILDHLEEDGRAEVVFKETLNYVHYIKGKHPDVEFEIVIRVDANVGLPANHDGLTGEAELPQGAGHTPAKIRVVVTWIEALGARALNTFTRPGDLTEQILPQSYGQEWRRDIPRHKHRSTMSWLPVAYMVMLVLTQWSESRSDVRTIDRW